MKWNLLSSRVVLFALVWVFACPSYGQNSDAPKILSNTYYLRNCNVVQKPGTILSNQNVLIKDGFITELGPSAKPTFEAQIISADSMYVYAGFIDGHSNTGITKPETKDRPKVTNPGAPPMDVAGITPHILASESFKSSDKSVADMRSAGFTVSQVAPRGLMLPGQSNIYMLGEGSSDKMLIKSATVQNFALEPARGVFPSTSIAVIAKFRELFKNANIAGTHEEKFKANPLGLARPDYTKEVMSLYPATIKKQTIQMVAGLTKDVHKALTLRDELGFDMTLVEVKQGWHYIDRIKSKNIGVMLSLDLPEEEKVKEVKDSTATKKDILAIKKDTISTKPKIEERKDIERDAFDAKRAESNKQYVSQAAMFEKQGVPFAFSMINGKPSDLKKNLARMIKAGLSENYALAALTTHPAKMMGMSNLLGTVEKGKIANLVVTHKPYFDEKSTIKYVFVDGKKFDYSTPKKPESKSDGKSNGKDGIVGYWSYSAMVNGQSQPGKMNVKKEENGYVIVLTDDSSPNDEDNAQDIKVDGKKLSFYIMADMDQPVKIDIEMTFDGKTFTGTASIPQMGTFNLTGEYISEPKSSQSY